MKRPAAMPLLRGTLAAVLMTVAHAALAASDPVQTPDRNDCDRCGKVETIKQVKVTDQWTPLGSTASSPTDGNPSGVTVYQIGKGFTNQGQVLLGAAGGGSYRTKPNELNTTRWEVTVRMDAGGNRVVTQNYEPMLREGDRVRVLGKQIELLQ
jgi:outer membrane lipoprotein SlyB